MDFKFTGYNPRLKNLARELRKQMTPQEKHLWYDFLKNYPIQFYRQRIIDRYIADFYCSKAKLVIELDGLQHFTDGGIKHDEYRTRLLNLYGIEVIRFTNREVNDHFEGVCRMIDKKVRERMSLLTGQGVL